MMVQQTAGVVWEGTIARGEGHLHSRSGRLDGLAVDLPNRMGAEHARTSPEEMLAGAHATCFAMALGSVLAAAKTPPERLAVEATVNLDTTEGNRRITAIDLSVTGAVPGADDDAFAAAVAQAEQLCLISRALSDDIVITATPTLEAPAAA
jgi:osmotically inducible protein OsmC